MRFCLVICFRIERGLITFLLSFNLSCSWSMCMYSNACALCFGSCSDVYILHSLYLQTCWTLHQVAVRVHWRVEKGSSVLWVPLGHSFKHSPLILLGLFSFVSCSSCTLAGLAYLTRCIKDDLVLFCFYPPTSPSAVAEVRACATTPVNVVLGTEDVQGLVNAREHPTY